MDPTGISILAGVLAGSMTSTKVFGTEPMNAAAVSGRSSWMDFRALVKEDCGNAGSMTFEIIQGPEYGYLTIRDAKGYPTFQRGNPRTKCSKLLVDGYVIEYTSKPVYQGPDIFSLKARTSLGYSAVRVYYVAVK